MGGTAVYRVSMSPSGGPEPPPRREPIPVQVDYDQFRTDMGLNTDQGDRDDQIAKLRKVVEAVPPTGAFTYFFFALALADEGCADLAEVAGNRAVRYDPNSAMSYFVLAVACGEKEDPSAASDYFNTALSLDRIRYFEYYKPLFGALYLRVDRAQAQAEVQRLDRLGVYIPQVFLARSGLLPMADVLKTCSP
jgi:tetratricopeptide (TPR) repeat protein